MDLIRPSAEQYREVLDYYRTGNTLESIADLTGLDVALLEELEQNGWPAEGKLPALPALRSHVLQRLTRLRAGELDAITSIVENAAKTAPLRARSAQMAAQIENAIMTEWAKLVTERMKATRKRRTSDDDLDIAPVTDLIMPKSVLENLRELRVLQNPAADRRFVDIFVKMGGHDADDEGGESLEDAIISDLSKLSREQLDEYTQTGKIPPAQQELFPAAATNDAASHELDSLEADAEMHDSGIA